METDRQLLKLAAKAAGYLLEDDDDEGLSWIIWGDNNVPMYNWNPLTDDGDALRLAVKLNFEMDIGRTYVHVVNWDGIKTAVVANEEPDSYAATRRAIVRAAAEIGKDIDEHTEEE